MTDRFARGLAGAALAVALVGLLLSYYAVQIGQQYLDDVRVLGESLDRLRGTSHDPAPLNPPPVQLDTD